MKRHKRDSDGDGTMAIAVAELEAAGIDTERRPQPVEIVVDGVRLLIRATTAVERVKLVKWMVANPHLPNLEEEMFTRSVCDESGRLLFTSGDVETIADTMSAEAVGAVAVAALRLNGMDK
ncbi:MAG: hypothetical protein K8U57_23080 [Planctomycetes bacterium]|nr:hypothetical protein [Planctomycetota bacterium]